MTTPDESLEQVDPTSVYGGYAQPMAGHDAGEHYYSHGDQMQDDPYGFEHGAACGCDEYAVHHDDVDAASFHVSASAVPDDSTGRAGFRQRVTRRRFIQGLAVAGTVGFGVVRGAKPVERQAIESQLAAKSASTGEAMASPVAAADLQVMSPNVDAVLNDFGVDTGLVAPAPVDQRVLVFIEFQGGNDGLSMVVPYGSSAYYDRRPRLAIAGEAVLPIDDQVGLSPSLARLHQRQLSTVEGVGPVDGVLSHFEMVERWELGDMRGRGGQRAGFLARLADAVDVGAAVTGLSVAGHTPRLDASRSSTLALNDFNQLRVLTNDDWIYPRYRSAVRSFGGGPMSTMITQSWDKLFDVGDSINGDIDKVDNESLMIQEGGGLGRQLAMAAEMIKADVGVRVVHASLGGFDTHDGHQGKHERLMRTFDAAVDGFLQEIDNAGMSDRVLVATSSEFGRRVDENGSGLDHGAASSMLVLGPVPPGRAGDPSPVGDLDRNGNLKTTVPFDRYLATLAQDWLGIDAASVLPDAPEPIGII
ncbi:MAG: DUF1501 domain-containing protein [Acidimicrobiales bacterium]